jgi:hypothetical protein
MRVTHINRRLRAWFRTITSDETDVFLCRDIH